ncbi:MAG: 4Fe-4S binding protein [Desulfovibrionaceae bacterium]|nr:4Fe-4S binding protein [Desulfovibrionaceae bacterium]
MLHVICNHNCKDCFAMHVCATGAILEQEGLIYLDTAKCIGCGNCKRICTVFGYGGLERKDMLRLSQGRARTPVAPQIGQPVQIQTGAV